MNKLRTPRATGPFPPVRRRREHSPDRKFFLLPHLSKAGAVPQRVDPGVSITLACEETSSVKSGMDAIPRPFFKQSLHCDPSPDADALYCAKFNRVSTLSRWWRR